VAAGLYETPANLPPFAAALRGELLGCALLEVLSAEDVATRIGEVPGAVAGGGGVRVYLVSYRTERALGVGGISTALVYLPDGTLAAQVPLVVAAHGSVGLGDSCAPSHLVHDPASFLTTRYFDGLQLAWAARGLPVIAPDYAGLGTDGVQGYDLWADSARSSLDGARALRSLLPADRLDGGTILSGHSQGGGVVLAAAAEAASVPDLDLRAVVSIAPGYRLFQSVDLLRFSSTALQPEPRAAVAAALYASLANLGDDPARYGDAFAEGIRDVVTEATATLCWDDLVLALDNAADGYEPPATLADLVDPAFSESVIQCADDGVCTALAEDWTARDAGNEPHLGPGGPPVLVIASTGDESATPGAVGCVLDRVEADGVTPDLCVYTGDDHRGLVVSSAAYAIEWALAAADGRARPPCEQDGTRSECSLL